MICSVPVLAQCDPNIDPFCEDPDLPIDGGVGILVAAGVLYGLKKFNDRNKTSP